MTAIASLCAGATPVSIRDRAERLGYSAGHQAGSEAARAGQWHPYRDTWHHWFRAAALTACRALPPDVATALAWYHAVIAGWTEARPRKASLPCPFWGMP